MAHPMGFYTKHGLNVEVVKTAGWAVVRDKTINKEYDASHMLSPMPIAITLGLGSQPVPFTVPAIENINGQGITLGDEAQGQSRSDELEGHEIRDTVRLLDPQLFAALLSCRARHRPGQRRTAARRCRRRRWSPIFAPTISTAFLRPTMSASARSTTASASCTSCRRRYGMAIRAALRGVAGLHYPDAQQLRRPDHAPSSTPQRLPQRPKIASRSRRRLRRRTISTSRRPSSSSASPASMPTVSAM